VKSALERTEREVALVRRKTGGVVRFEKARRLLAVEAVHTSSRLGRDQDVSGIPDPQLHSHVAVIAAERRDGRLAAVESKQLFRAAREAARGTGQSSPRTSKPSGADRTAPGKE